ncbi:MAG: hypothetical protein DRH90_17645 [Deltaproteobacteria bacterium]|nr:MAG: hypothetical protein DRH90_17645 [Deltaproteobacteria bacterium]RLC12880.1 MAG: hypothetical protein DRI24_16795 [Deltaproteobacteria bacterium]
MIQPDYQQDELTAIWTEILNIHRTMKLGNPITHPMKQRVSLLASKIVTHQEELKRCRIYIPRSAQKNPLLSRASLRGPNSPLDKSDA